MLVLRLYRILVAPSGKKRIMFDRILHKWTNKEVQEDLDFDFFDELAWKKFLRDDFRLPNGNRLPKLSVDGEPVVYQVYFWGTPIWVKEHFVKEGINDGYACLYPGYDKDHNRRKIMDYGDIFKKWV